MNNNECDTCSHNRGSYCDASACWEGESYEDRKRTCPKCGGLLSAVREHRGKRYRHCYSCHFEFEEGIE